MTVLEIAMLENQTIKEVRAARQKISEQHGHDLVRLVDHYKKLQRDKLERRARSLSQQPHRFGVLKQSKGRTDVAGRG